MKRSLTVGAVISGALMAWASLGLIHTPHPTTSIFTYSTPAAVTSFVYSKAPVLTPVLSDGDVALYRDLFHLQQKGDWKAADAVAKEITNPVLMGYANHQRYTHKSYTADYNQLHKWLARYADQPNASDIYHRAVAKKKSGHAKLISPVKQRTLGGYGDNNGLASSRDINRGRWMAAIADWKSGNKASAAKQFSAMADNDKVDSPWEISAAAFWAYRAYKEAGERRKADEYLMLAASHPRTFYGILARKSLGQSLEVMKAPQLSDSETRMLYTRVAVQRMVALTQVGKLDEAEREMRALFPTVDKDKQVQLLALAHSLALPAVQISMARALSTPTQSFDYGLYPIPHWQPHEGFALDDALIFAFARQESGFRNNAKSPVGATGVMQLMPKTAALMKRRVKETMPDAELTSLVDPQANVTLGQSYIDLLLDMSAVQNNLIYVAAAYNAGPGRLIEWKSSLRAGNDPLLFLESIPFDETRYYAMQVLTNYWMYMELDGRPAASAVALAQGDWPEYESASVFTQAGLGFGTLTQPRN